MAGDEFAHVVYSARLEVAVEIHRSHHFISDCEMKTVLRCNFYPLLTYGTEDGVKVTFVGP